VAFQQSQVETDLRCKTEEHTVSLHKDKFITSYENNYSPALRGWHKAAVGFGYYLACKSMGTLTMSPLLLRHLSMAWLVF